MALKLGTGKKQDRGFVEERVSEENVSFEDVSFGNQCFILKGFDSP